MYNKKIITMNATLLPSFLTEIKPYNVCNALHVDGSFFVKLFVFPFASFCQMLPGIRKRHAHLCIIRRILDKFP